VTRLASVEGAEYAVDWLFLRSGYVAAWGWLRHRDAPVSSVALVFDTRGTPAHLEGHYGIRRHDVVELGDAIQNRNCGFVFFGRVPEDAPRRASLVATLASGRTCRIEVDIATLAGAPGHMHGVLRGLCPPGILARVGLRAWWARVLLGHIARRGLSRLLRIRGRSLPRFRAGASPVRQLSVEALLEVLASARARPLSLMIDHNLGGGTTLYREQWIRRHTSSGGAVILLLYDFHRLQYFLRCATGERDETFAADELEMVLMLAAGVTFDEIFVNNVCSFPDPVLAADLSLQLARLTGAPLTIAIHDYFSVCPSWNLLNDRGQFCAVPHIAECRRCLPNIRGEVRSLVGCDDIDRWRAAWGQCLAEATTILCFSESSRQLIGRAYPDLSPDKFAVRPHAVDDLPDRTSRRDLPGPLHIGVVGEVTRAKGAAIVREMARLIRTQHLPARITVIGQLDKGRESPVLRILGPYQREALPDLVDACGANVFLLPSVWPETFSYVAEELMRLGVPLAVFNMGAPAERVAYYPNGLILDRVDAAHALKRLMAFHAMLQTPRR
jgi:glycosyltransferase involved in cell wall biosynthesis